MTDSGDGEVGRGAMPVRTGRSHETPPASWARQVRTLVSGPSRLAIRTPLRTTSRKSLRNQIRTYANGDAHGMTCDSRKIRRPHCASSYVPQYAPDAPRPVCAGQLVKSGSVPHLIGHRGRIDADPFSGLADVIP